jgi:hypothetical protein
MRLNERPGGCDFSGHSSLTVIVSTIISRTTPSDMIVRFLGIT